MKKIFTINDIPSIVQNDLLPRLATYKIFTFTGPLGAGKTTLIKNFLKQCGVTTVVTSPTFAYVNTYSDDKNKRTFHHFDLYRLTSLEAFIDAGFDEYLQSPSDWILIEWPEIIAPLLASAQHTPQVCKVLLTYGPKGLSSRQIEIIP